MKRLGTPGSDFAGRRQAYRSSATRKATLTERKPEPTGVVMGPLMATFVDRTDSTTSSGSGAPPRSIATAPASWRSQTIGTPLAAITVSRAVASSGPVPSPGMSVTR